MTLRHTFIIGALMALVLTIMLAFAVLVGPSVTGAATTFTVPTKPAGTFQYYTFFTATTTTATSTNTTDGSGYMVVAGAKRVDMYFSRGDTTGQGNVGVSKFRIQVSPDGVNFFDFSRLIGSDVSATATTSISIGAATSTTFSAMDLRTDAFYAIRCIVNETTDGEHTCKASAEF